MATKFCVVTITAPRGAVSRKIARAILKERLAACVNIVASVSSSYWWKGKIESAGEALLVIKTRRSLLPRLIGLVQKIHPYSVPEIISLPIITGNKPYLQWLGNETRK